MALSLPRDFDTSDVVLIVMRGIAGILAVTGVGILYSILISHRWTGVVAMVVTAAIIAYFGVRIAGALEGTVGTISAAQVVVRPARVYGVRLAGPEGTFAIRQFKAVRLESVQRPTEGWGRLSARVSLVGRDGVPDILVERAERSAGEAFGRDLASALNLPIEESLAAY